MKPPKGRVLILDDDAAIGRSIALFVEFFEMEAIAVCHPDEFFAELDRWRPTHIILDLLMPGKDGVEILQLLGVRGCRARVAICSGVGSRILNAARQSGAEHGLDVAGVFPKPFTMSALREFLYAIEDAGIPGNETNLCSCPVTRDEILAAIAAKQFFLHFQPKTDCLTGKTMGVEALVRWNHPTKGLVMPDQFIPISEATALIGLLTEQIIDEAFRWYSSAAAIQGLSLSINISAKTLGELDFTEWLEAMCKKASLTPDCIVLEVTETAAMVDQLSALDMFTRLRMKGFQVSIDDFGIGNSSLALLARLPFSELKIDRSFAMTAMTSAESRAIIKSTVELGHSLNLSVAVEGVEDQSTLDFLRDIRCDLAQGYFIGRPMPGAQVEEWILARGK